MEGISLGWNCSAAQDGIKLGIRKTKNEGYKTGPFDMMITNYVGLCKCIEEDFENFCNAKYLSLIDAPDVKKFIPNQKDGEKWIYNSYYKFVYNHESPYHGNLYLNEQWSSPYHFVENNFENFIKRYEKRIESFRNYLNNTDHINFILYRYNSLPTELINILKNKYPNLRFTIYHIYDFGKNNIGFLYDTSDNGGKEYEKFYLNYLGITESEYPNEHNRYNIDLLNPNYVNHENIKLINPKTML